ncbi:hypothetical protein ASPZODRAFT_144116 [Penicilliopsis zonata CBS 506.65]|uniref:Uncharacterized protein n=1 Tax=Penicilliopsis zonata CBS 506.65 TaxID=1073090 RepID=A0A1L9SEG6_9EURO|nr:hypothetical protein ASPZODRAFT_144116 [Penicilliopsis zonata CBS 506.65]OJJ45487.1 hypothetical protein ASPZODRAFT_144116 [Penicilliopsis zonata CBS 506.65]
MPTRLSTPVLTVDTGKIRKVDTANTQSLHGMWMVFSKCADYMEEGRRLENLTWRLWTRETFCVEPENSSDTSVLPLLRSESSEMPELSASVESASSDQADRIEEHIKRPKGPDPRPAVVRDDSLSSLSRGREKHITSLGLERMVLSIKEKKNLEPIPHTVSSITPIVDVSSSRPSTPTPTLPAVTPVQEEEEQQKQQQQQEDRRPSHTLTQQQNPSTESCSTTAPEYNESDAAPVTASDTSVSSSGILPPRPDLFKSPSIVRGFSPSQISSSYRSQPALAPEPASTKVSSATQQLKPSLLKNKKGGMFLLGGSSGDDDESSFEDRMNMPNTHRSSLSDELGRPTSSLKNLSPSKKAPSFREQIAARMIKPIREGPREDDEDAIETDDEEVSESAIEDDEDSDWEDSVTESGRSSVDEKELFQRVDSRPNLVSRRSLLTMMMHQPTKMGNVRSTPALQRSRLTSPNGPSLPASEDDEEENLTMRGPDVPRSKPIIVKPPVSQHSVAHSPRTTRRNMLATELTESLRRHLLWERQQKSATANAFLKRRHTAHDMANLQQYPDPRRGAAAAAGSNAADAAAPTDSEDAQQAKDLAKNGSWNNYTDYGPWEYHVKGW